MTDAQKAEITKISQEFFSGFEGTFDTINGTGWLVADPLSGYLNSVGYQHTLSQLPENEKHPQVLILEFPNGSWFIPAGGDLKSVIPTAENWLWIDN
ncbi:hypothetical protein FAES_1859 [Fibrella aestuarina BUZ 2]|uniref:Uncharacterized protein n=1 Tax=Fibrella aestuarina BUZ 2 TaxID=1166018 RepID=I0K6W5_9BACT|nr:hypothetical protein [Fibrella aestuarina]CCG99868.1 hypothetical protein FAES_1859 [Fibrella aestuarina BUZ 2]